MITIDTDTMLIEMTRGDTATISFGAKEADGSDYVPQAGDVLTFAVAKKWGGEPIFQVVNRYDDNPTDFWDIRIEAEQSALLGFKDYVWDVQIETGENVETIIGKTDDIEPKLRAWGEVSEVNK